jgi:hypothetical protein
MRPLDYLKASGLGLLAMALNLAASVPVILAWRWLVIPGRPESAYRDLPLQIAPWSSHILGPLIFAALIWLFSRRRPARDVWKFAAVAWGAYALVDLAGAAMATGPAALLSPVLLLSLIGKLGGAMVGAWLATRRAGSTD